MNEFYHNAFLFFLMVIDLKFNLLFMNQLNCPSRSTKFLISHFLLLLITLSLDSANLYVCDLLEFFRAAYFAIVYFNSSSNHEFLYLIISEMQSLCNTKESHKDIQC